MHQRIIKICGLLALVGVFILSIAQTRALASNPAQQATAIMATVTSTPIGPMAVVVPGPEPQINLRSGPNTTYDLVGVLLVGQKVPAKGRSPGGAGSWLNIQAYRWGSLGVVSLRPHRPARGSPHRGTPAYTNSGGHQHDRSYPGSQICGDSGANASGDLYAAAAAQYPHI